MITASEGLIHCPWFETHGIEGGRSRIRATIEANGPRMGSIILE